jgi:hypothetical protein
MSSAYFIVLDHPDPGFDTMVNGKALAREARRLAMIARSLGLRELNDFVSYSPDEALAMMEDLGTDLEDLETSELPPKQWFAAQEGMDFVARVAEHVQANPDSVKHPAKVLAELQQFQQVWQQAQAIGARWCLQVDF